MSKLAILLSIPRNIIKLDECFVHISCLCNDLNNVFLTFAKLLDKP